MRRLESFVVRKIPLNQKAADFLFFFRSVFWIYPLNLWFLGQSKEIWKYETFLIVWAIVDQKVKYSFGVSELETLDVKIMYRLQLIKYRIPLKMYNELFFVSTMTTKYSDRRDRTGQFYELYEMWNIYFVYSLKLAVDNKFKEQSKFCIIITPWLLPFRMW